MSLTDRQTKEDNRVSYIGFTCSPEADHSEYGRRPASGPGQYQHPSACLELRAEEGRRVWWFLSVTAKAESPGLGWEQTLYWSRHSKWRAWRCSSVAHRQTGFSADAWGITIRLKTELVLLLLLLRHICGESIKTSRPWPKANKALADGQ